MVTTNTVVDDASRRGSDLSVGVDVGHDVVTADLLLLGSDGKVLVRHGQMSGHLGQGLVGDAINADLLLGLGKPVPELAPSGMAGPGSEELLHLRGRIAGVQRGLLQVSNHFSYSKPVYPLA